jgi:hypothetical protein
MVGKETELVREAKYILLGVVKLLLEDEYLNCHF